MHHNLVIMHDSSRKKHYNTSQCIYVLIFTHVDARYGHFVVHLRTQAILKSNSLFVHAKQLCLKNHEANEANYPLNKRGKTHSVL